MNTFSNVIRRSLVVVALLITSSVLLAGCGEKASDSGTETVTTGESRYVQYSAAKFADATFTGQQRVLYFHANWCPDCKLIHEDFQKNSAQIPEGVVVFQTDYDAETELKQKYAVTHQHTFVLVDSAGEEIKKWVGGDLAQLVAELSR